MTQKQTPSKQKKKDAPTPVYKPYLRGNMISRISARRGLKITGLMLLFAFFGVLAGGSFGFKSQALRLVLNGVLLLFCYTLMYNEGSRMGESDVTFAEIAQKRLDEGHQVDPKDRDVCFHRGKGFFSALIGAAPFLLIALVYALIAHKQTYTLGVLPDWVQGYENQPEIGGALAYYHETAAVRLEDILRLIVRLLLFPYVNMFGAGSYDRMYLLDRLSPLLVLIVPLFYGLGYLRGPRLRALVHGNIRMARRRHNKKERKAREQRSRKAQQKKELI